MWHSTGPSRPVNYWKHANGDGMFAACKDDGERASWLAAAVDPTKWREKALSELCLLAFGQNRLGLSAAIFTSTFKG